MYISYGSHSNDFLLAEYGFILDKNRWDEVSLDPFILPMLSVKQKQVLDDAGFLGKYVLDSDAVCYRTQVALRLLCLPQKKWQRFVHGLDDGEKDQVAVDRLVTKVIQSYLDHVDERVEMIKKVDSDYSAQGRTLIHRWMQTRLVLEKYKSAF
jgi:hypothetical protein